MENINKIEGGGGREEENTDTIRESKGRRSSNARARNAHTQSRAPAPDGLGTRNASDGTYNRPTPGTKYIRGLRSGGIWADFGYESKVVLFQIATGRSLYKVRQRRRMNGSWAQSLLRCTSPTPSLGAQNFKEYVSISYDNQESTICIGENAERSTAEVDKSTMRQM